jgi:GAF domain-containing protein
VNDDDDDDDDDDESVEERDAFSRAMHFTSDDEGLALLVSKQIGVQMYFSTIFSKLQRAEATTSNLLEMARFLGTATKNDSVSAMVMRITEVGKSLIGCDRCSLFLVDKGQMWTVVKSKDMASNITIRLPLGLGVAGQTALSGQMMNIHDAYKSDYFNPEYDRKTGYHTKTILCVPMLSENKDIILGVLQLINKNDGTVFNSTDEDLAQKFVDLAAIAVHNSFEIETLRVGRDESTLQVLPVHELNRISFKRGWPTVRNNISRIARMDNSAVHSQSQLRADYHGSQKDLIGSSTSFPAGRSKKPTHQNELHKKTRIPGIDISLSLPVNAVNGLAAI